MQAKPANSLKLVLSSIVIIIACHGCKEPALMFRPIVVDRANLNKNFDEPGVTSIVFQNENAEGDRKLKKRHRYQLTAYQRTKDTFRLIDKTSIFNKPGNRNISLVGIKIGKNGLTTDFANYYLPKNYIPADSLNDKKFVLLYPTLLGETGNDRNYIRYIINLVNEQDIPDVVRELNNRFRILGKSDAQQAILRSRAAAKNVRDDQSLNPSPPRNVETEF